MSATPTRSYPFLGSICWSLVRLGHHAGYTAWPRLGNWHEVSLPRTQRRYTQFGYRSIHLSIEALVLYQLSYAAAHVK